MSKKVGNTVLYIPMEGLQCSPEEASKDKKLVQRMESKPEELCLCVGAFLFPSISVGSMSKRSHSQTFGL